MRFYIWQYEQDTFDLKHLSTDCTTFGTFSTMHVYDRCILITGRMNILYIKKTSIAINLREEWQGCMGRLC